MPRKLLVGGVQRNGSTKGPTIKKVAPPIVPSLTAKPSHLKRSPCVCHTDQLTLDFGDTEGLYDSELGHYTKPPRSSSIGSNYCSSNFYNSSFHHSISMKKMTPGGGSNGQIHLAHVIVHSQPDSLPSTPSDTGHSPNLTKGRMISGTQASLEDQGIDLNSPGRHSPGGSSGGSSISRHSLSSLDSGRASAPGNDGKVVNRRLSIQSYEGSSPQRRSYHSSSSSIASVGDESVGQGPNVAEMVLHGLPDVEILSNWLASLHFEEYIQLFLLAGYDMPTITRMTPEDLTAIGITKPNHRRKLKAEIAKLKITDGIPEYKPNSLLEWLQLLRLEEYFDTLCHQNYNTIDKVTDLTWEDLEDIGIQKLGHQKRILLAIKRIEDINQGRRPNLYPQMSHQNNSDIINSGSATFPRPSTLNNVQPYHYPSQEVAIATHRPKSSPSTDSIPEMKTFQQSPVKEEASSLQPAHNSTYNSTTSSTFNNTTSSTFNSMTTTFNNMTSATFSSTTNSTYNSMASQHHNGSINPVLSPCRGHSLESLTTENTSLMANPVPQQVTSYGPSPLPTLEPPKVQAKDWRVTDLDTDCDYECEGTATLNRPKGLVKLRPVAKITAKTREEIAEAIMDIPDKEFKSLINQSKVLDGWTSLDGSPRHGPSTVPRAGMLKRAPPPPPPKRSNSTKGDRQPAELKKDDASNTKQKIDLSSRPVPVPRASEAPRSEDFPPPPSPLPSAVDDKAKQGTEKTEAMDELFNNPLFRQRRKDSSESSSVDGAAMPFANEAVGTIKQKSLRPYPSLPIESSKSSNQRKEHGSQRGRNLSQNHSSSNEQHEYDLTPEAISPGDVIDDIENMLANLSDQLDAMLDSEQVQK